MRRRYHYGVIKNLVIAVVVVLAACTTSPSGPPQSQTAGAKDSLPSWNDGATKTAIVDFVKAVTTSGCRDDDRRIR